jgi:hypothetical protein
MIIRTFPAAAFCAALAATAAAAQPALHIEHAAARVIVIPEARGDVVYTIQPGHAGLPPLQARRDGGVIVLDGGLEQRSGLFGLHRGANCQGSGDHARVRIPGHGDVAFQDLPVITAHTPLNVRLTVGEAVFGEVGPSQSLDLANAGCGDWRVGDVRGPATFSLAGSGDVRARNTGEAMVRISGSSDVYLGAVQGALDARVSGSGDVRAASVAGPLTAKISGSGDVTIDGGVSPSVMASIAGSGDLKFRGTAGALSASIAGSGDVDVARVTGAVSKRIAGSGDVNVGR